MERLTEKHYGTDGYYTKCSEVCANDDEMCGGCPELDKIIDAYEDTGLTPEEVVQMAQELRTMKETARVIPVIKMREEVPG